MNPHRLPAHATPTSSMFDGGGNNGMWTVHRATQVAIKKANAQGFALALAMQALGVLAGSGADPDQSAGYLIIAIKPDLMLPLAGYRRDLSVASERLKAVPRQPGVDEIRIPSERAFRERARSLRVGIELDQDIVEALTALGGA